MLSTVSAVGSDTASRPRTSYGSTVSNVGLPTTDTESGFTRQPYSSSVASTEWSTTGTEQPQHSAADLHAVPIQHEAEDLGEESAGSSIEEEEETTHTYSHEPLHQALAVGQGPSDLGTGSGEYVAPTGTESHTVHFASETTPNPSHYEDTETTPHLVQHAQGTSTVDGHLEAGDLPVYSGSAEHSLEAEKKLADPVALPSFNN
jgi:hypothetical protein